MFRHIKHLSKTVQSLNRYNIFITQQCHIRAKSTGAKSILSKNEINIYKRLFDEMDSNKDGYLTKDDLKKGLKEFVNYSATEEELKDTMDTLDRDKDGSVGFDEFIDYIAWSRQMRSEEAIRYAFETFDRNKDGLINKNELREALVSLGFVPNESLLNNIMLITDVDSDGNISFEEFKKVFYSKDITQ